MKLTRLIRCVFSILALLLCDAPVARANFLLPPAPNNFADGFVQLTWGAVYGQGTAPEFSYFTTDIQPGGGSVPTPPIPPGRYATWCLDSSTMIDPGGPLDPNSLGAVGTMYGGQLYSSQDPNLNSHLPDHPNVKKDLATWNKINWIINNRRLACNGTVPTMWEVQTAISALLGQFRAGGGFPPFRQNVVDCLVNGAVAADAAGWVPGCGDNIAVIFNIDVNWDEFAQDVQVLFLEVPWPCIPCPPITLTKACLIPPPAPEPFLCSDAKPIDAITMIWAGAQTIGVKAWKGPANSSALLATIDNVAPGASVTVAGYAGSPNDVYWEIFNTTTSGAKIGESTFHLSCSDIDMNGPEDCGKLAGDGKARAGFINQWIFEGMSGNGKTLGCTPVPPTPAQNCEVLASPFASCETLGKPTSLTFRYTGGGCAAGNNPQGGKFICSGAINPALAVNITSANGYAISPSTVLPGQEFTVTGSFGSQSSFTLQNAGGSETLSIHTSCSQPLAVGDIFGSLTLVGFNGQMGGSPVIYRYTVSNLGADALSGLFLTDDPLGPIAGPFALAAGETKVFDVPMQINSDTTNTATVSIQGREDCSISTGEVVVRVKHNCPTPVATTTAFSCSGMKPIDSLSMTWSGSQTIGIRAWKGPVNTSVLLATIDDIQPGETVTVTGYAGAPNDVYWELFDGGIGGAKLGESTFHLSCSDDDMNGPEDCGKAQGDGKARAGFINQWIFEGMSGNGQTIGCSVPPAPAPTAIISGKQLKWRLSNTTAVKVTMTGMSLTWPAVNGKLLKVKLDGDVIWDKKSLAGQTSITLAPGDLTTDTKKKSIDPNKIRTFILEFEKDAATDLTKYDLSVLFGQCVLSLW